MVFNKLKDELVEMKAKTAVFVEEVNKLSKFKAIEKQATVVQEIDLPDNLKPYAEGTDPSTFYVDENGHIVAIYKDGDDICLTQASNFVARIKEVREFDDGVDIIQQFVIEGILEGTKICSTLS